MKINNKKIYIKPTMTVVSVETETLIALSGYNVDSQYGGGIKNQSKEDDWDELDWGRND